MSGLRGLHLILAALLSLACEPAPAGPGEQRETALPDAWPGLYVELGETTHALSPSAAAMLKEARGYLRSGQTFAAEPLYNRLRELYPRDPALRFEQALVCIDLEKYGMALVLYRELHKERPGHPRLGNNLAWIAAFARNTGVRHGGRARSQALDTILRDPTSYRTWYILSEACFITARYEKALQAAETALRLADEQGEQPQYLAAQREKCRFIYGFGLVE